MDALKKMVKKELYYSKQFRIMAEARIVGKDSLPIKRWNGGDYVIDTDNIGRYLKFKKNTKENQEITVPIDFAYDISLALSKVYKVLIDPETFTIDQLGTKIINKEKLKLSTSLVETHQYFDNIVIKAGFDEHQMEGAYISGDKIMIFIPWNTIGKIREALRTAEDKLDKFIMMDLILTKIK